MEDEPEGDEPDQQPRADPHGSGRARAGEWMSPARREAIASIGTAAPSAYATVRKMTRMPVTLLRNVGADRRQHRPSAGHEEQQGQSVAPKKNPPPAFFSWMRENADQRPFEQSELRHEQRRRRARRGRRSPGSAGKSCGSPSSLQAAHVANSVNTLSAADEPAMIRSGLRPGRPAREQDHVAGQEARTASRRWITPA